MRALILQCHTESTRTIPHRSVGENAKDFKPILQTSESKMAGTYAEMDTNTQSLASLTVTPPNQHSVSPPCPNPLLSCQAPSP